MEYEIKFQISNTSQLEERIKRLGAKFIAEVYQVDYYFNHPERDFSKTDEALRVRVEDGNVILTYKGPRKQVGVKAREEIEVKVDNAESLLKILERLGFRPFIVIRKKRKIYQIDDIKILIDNVESLGSFVEIEYITSLEDRELALKKIEELTSKLGFSLENGITKTYLELLINKFKGLKDRVI